MKKLSKVERLMRRWRAAKGEATRIRIASELARALDEVWDSSVTDLVFRDPPSAEGGPRFVEAETVSGESVRVGEWVDLGVFEAGLLDPSPPTKLWALRLRVLQ